MILAEQNNVDTSTPVILVVDDDEEIQSTLHDLLKAAEYKPLVAASGEEALAAVTQAPVDLVLLDLKLPDMHGYQVCEQIRADAASDIPVLILTANQEPGSVAQGLRLGADDYLQKPFTSDELLSRIEVLLRRRHAKTALISKNEALRTTLEELRHGLEHERTVSQTEAILRREFLHHVTTHLHALQGVIESEYRRAPLGQSREIVQRILTRVHSVALVYLTSATLQDDPTRIDTVISTIAGALKQVYAPRRRLPLVIRGDNLEVPLRYAAPIAMIVNELVTNCFKHAFSDHRFGSITVEYEVKDGAFCLDVIDDGIGMPTKVAPEGRGISTVRALAAELGGAANWRSENSGTVASVRFPYGAVAPEDEA